MKKMCLLSSSFIQNSQQFNNNTTNTVHKHNDSFSTTYEKNEHFIDICKALVLRTAKWRATPTPLLLIASYGIHFSPDSGELLNGSRLAVFVFPFSELLLICRTVQDMRFRILATVEMILHIGLHFFVYVTGFDGIRETVRISEEKL